MFALLSFRWRYRFFWFLRKKREDAFTTRIYEGLPGEGKTLFATRDGIDLMREGIRVAANYRIKDPVSGQEALPMTSWVDMLRLAVQAMIDEEPMVFIIDEVHLWANARFFKKTPGWWLNLIAQRRHYRIGIIATTQNLRRVEVVLRELVDELVKVRNLTRLRVPLFRIERVDRDGLDDEQGYTIESGRLVLMPWYAYAGYSTEELQAVEEWNEEDDMKREIAGLLSQAEVLALRAPLPALADELAALPA